MMLLKEPARPCVTQAGALWNRFHNSDEIARALNITEPQALKLIDEARQRGMIA